MAVIRVCDNGIGIAPEHIDSVFDLFVQADTSIERSRDGLGIGLTLVQRLVELHGGTIEVQSEGPGRGSTFTVRLALQPTAAEAPKRPVPAPAPVPDPAAKRVLVVDDSRDAAQSLAMLLEFEGHEIHTAHDGAAAVTAAERVRPDVVLMDIGLPIVDGYEACRRIRGQAWGSTMLMVAITGWGQEDDREQSSAAGFDRHLVKPVDHDELLRVIASPRRRGSA
jgi:CheY-like chemotaxis protein